MRDEPLISVTPSGFKVTLRAVNIETVDAASARLVKALLMHLDAQDREINRLRATVRREAERHATREARYLSKIHGLRSQLNMEHAKKLDASDLAG